MSTPEGVMGHSSCLVSTNELGSEETETVALALRDPDGKDVPVDYVLTCEDTNGKKVRYETHKQVLMLQSTFFESIFATCASKDGAQRRPTKEGRFLEELEMAEGKHVVLVLLLSMYGSNSELRKELQMKQSEFDGGYLEYVQDKPFFELMTYGLSRILSTDALLQPPFFFPTTRSQVPRISCCRDSHFAHLYSVGPTGNESQQIYARNLNCGLGTLQRARRSFRFPTHKGLGVKSSETCACFC